MAYENVTDSLSGNVSKKLPLRIESSLEDERIVCLETPEKN
jgi:predicted protein tyrosine phosphatase